MAAFGLPQDLGELASRPADEFEASAGELTRAVGALDVRGVGSDALPFEAAEFDATGRVGFVPAAALLQAGSDLQAPTLVKRYFLPVDTKARAR